MDDHIITISEYHFGEGWTMRIDLKELADSAGKRKKLVNPRGGVFDELVLSLPMARAVKLLHLIRRYGTEEDYEKCDRYFVTNTRLNKWWREICQD